MGILSWGLDDEVGGRTVTGRLLREDGTPEGAKKGWETRKGGSPAAGEPGSRRVEMLKKAAAAGYISKDEYTARKSAKTNVERIPGAWLMGATQAHEKRGLSPGDAHRAAVQQWLDQQKMAKAAGHESESRTRELGFGGQGMADGADAPKAGSPQTTTLPGGEEEAAEAEAWYDDYDGEDSDCPDSLRDENGNCPGDPEYDEYSAGDYLSEDEVAPPGREKQVRALKKKPGVENPYAVAWSQYNQSEERERCEALAEGEVAPPGWEGTVKAMKGHKDIDNPWALAWYMKGQGASPHKKAPKAEGENPPGIVYGDPVMSPTLSERPGKFRRVVQAEAVEADAAVVYRRSLREAAASIDLAVTDTDVRAAWEASHPADPAVPYNTIGWVSSVLVTESAVIVNRMGKNYRIPYALSGDSVVFDDGAAVEVRRKDFFPPVSAPAREAEDSAGTDHKYPQPVDAWQTSEGGEKKGRRAYEPEVPRGVVYGDPVLRQTSEEGEDAEGRYVAQAEAIGAAPQAPLLRKPGRVPALKTDRGGVERIPLGSFKDDLKRKGSLRKMMIPDKTGKDEKPEPKKASESVRAFEEAYG